MARPSLQPPIAPSTALGRNLGTATLSGVALALVFLVTLAMSHWAFLAFIGLCVVGALEELRVGFGAAGLRVSMPVAVVAGLVALFGAYAVGPPAQALALVLTLVGAVGWALAARAPRETANPLPAVLGATCLAVVWVPFLASFVSLLLARPGGHWYVLATVGLTVADDVGAFAFGSRLGRHRLAPSVSPAKTWEGFAGGLVVSLVAAVAVIAWLPGFTPTVAVALSAAVVAAATLGDLTESLVKRDLGVKDLGHVLPGHGGIMDRVDAVLFALPVAHLLLRAVGV